MQKQKYILPIGFYDLLDQEAKINQETIDILLGNFYQKNYQLIKTPLLEFEESITTDGENSNECFKMVDNLSGKTLLLRSDITPQIARLMATKLQNINLPVRLCYVGDVVKTKNDNLYADRQLTQVGAELIGVDSCEANFEIINLTLSSLEKIKLNNLIINFCLPKFLDQILGKLQLENIDDIKDAVINKNISAIKNLAGKYANLFIDLVLENNDFNKINAAIKDLKLDDDLILQIQKWQKTILSIKEKYPTVEISFDIFGDDEFSYHHDIGFTIFNRNFSYPIARGGKYFITGKNPAIGATIYINNLRKIFSNT